MADAALGGLVHLRKGLPQFRHQEHRVVAEAARTARRLQDHPRAVTFHLQLDRAAGIGHRQGGGEAGAAVGAGRPPARPVHGRRSRLQLAEEPVDALQIGGGIAGRVHPRRSTEGRHRQAGIIGQGPAARGQCHGGGFQASVLGEGGPRFLHLQALRLGLNPQGKLRQQGSKLAHLAGIAAGDHKGGWRRRHQLPSASSRAQASTAATRSAVGASQ